MAEFFRDLGGSGDNARVDVQSYAIVVELHQGTLRDVRLLKNEGVECNSRLGGTALFR